MCAARLPWAAAIASQMSAKVQSVTASSRYALLLAARWPRRAFGSQSNRERRRGLDLLHGEGRADVGERSGGDQALVEGVVGADVLDHDLQQIVGFARQPIELHHLGQ